MATSDNSLATPPPVAHWLFFPGRGAFLRIKLGLIFSQVISLVCCRQVRLTVLTNTAKKNDFWPLFFFFKLQTLPLVRLVGKFLLFLEI